MEGGAVRDGGLVRAILGVHLARRHPVAADAAGAADDPNRLVDAWAVAQVMASVAATDGEPALRQAAADYVALWARTFRTLVRHLRGRPERALALFAEEVYPYLRGDRLAARVEAARPGQAIVLLQADLPAPYLAGLLEAFVGLSGARATATPEAAGRFRVAYRLEGADRVARLAQALAAQRIHLILLACAGTVVGVALAARALGGLASIDAWRIAAIVAGAAAAQVGANALHDLRHAHPSGPLDLRSPDRRSLLVQARLGYAAATACGAALAIQAPAVIAFALAGLAFSAAFGHLKNVGWGPLLAGIIYGPLLAMGALYAAAPAGLEPRWVLAHLGATVPLGALAAAVLYADDLADRPLDEAGGLRTLLVRLPRRRHLAGYTLLVAGAVAALAAFCALVLALASPAVLVVLAAFALGAAALVATVQHNLDDPRGLAPVRFGTLALHVAAAATLTSALLGAFP